MTDYKTAANSKFFTRTIKILVCIICIALMVPLVACNNKNTSSGDSKIVDDAKKQNTSRSDSSKKKKLDTPPTRTAGGGASASSASGEGTDSQLAPSNGNIDLDLTGISKNVVYAQVMQMMMEPQKFEGKKIKMSGQFVVYEPSPENASTASSSQYYAIIIADALACCQQGIEFVWPDHTYPDGYPAIGSNASVTGRFETYKENDIAYCRLVAESVVAE